MKHYTFAFDVTLINHDVDVLPNISTKEVVDWYTNTLEDVGELYNAYNVVVSYEGDHYMIAFDIDEHDDDDESDDESDDEDDAEFVAEMLVDPDDDGNYPIEYDGVPYLISGSLII